MEKTIRNKLFLMMVLELFIWGAWLPKLYAYMSLLKFEPGQISLVFSVFGIASIIAIFFSNQFADRNFAAEKFLAFSHVVGGLALLVVSTQHDFWPFFICFLIYGIFYVPTISVANSLAFANLKDPAKEFGFVRMGGTIGWILASWPFVFLLVGDRATDPAFVKWIFIVAAIGSFVMAAFSLTLPHTPPRNNANGMDKLAWVRALKLLGTPYILLLFIVTFIDAVIHNGYFLLSDTYLQNRVGIEGNLSMVVQSLGQVAEIGTMVILGVVLARLGWKTTMIIGIAGHAARFLIFALFADIQPLIIAVQLLHGICYAFFFATVYIFVDEVFPKDVRTSAQGLFNLLILGFGSVVAGILFPQFKAFGTIPTPTDLAKVPFTVSASNRGTGKGEEKTKTKTIPASPLMVSSVSMFHPGDGIEVEGFPKREIVKINKADNSLILNEALKTAPAGGKTFVAFIVDWKKIYLVPSGMAVVAMILMALFFKPPFPRPQQSGPIDAVAAMDEVGEVIAPP